MNHKSDTECAYHATHKLIAHTVYKFWMTFGGDREEIQSECGLLFMQAVEKYNPDRGTKFSTWLRFYLWHQLLESRRNQNKRTLAYLRYADHLRSKRNFDRSDFLDSLSPDARRMATRALHTGEDNPGRLLKHFLKLGWAAERVLNSFLEVREALP